eukprot:scaffold33673_cov37-Cyclotella_meneghiniana.AAC.1
MPNEYASHGDAGQLNDDLATQSFDEDEFSDDSSTDAMLSTIDLSSPGASSAPVDSVDGILRNKKTSPLDVATDYIGRYVQTLQWSSQISAYHEMSDKFLRLFSQWYHECQSIKKAETLDAYKPSSCRVSSRFLQPCDRVKEGPAYLSLRNESDTKCLEWSLERGTYHLRMPKINNDAKQEEYLELLAYAFWRMAQILLSSIEGLPYGPHNLVADMLLITHSVVLKNLCSLEDFIRIYKSRHKCGRAMEDPDAMYARRFGVANESNGDVTQQNLDHPSNSTLPVSNLFSTAPTPPSEESPPQTIQEVERMWRARLAMAIAVADDSQNMQKMLENSKMAELGKLGKDLINKDGGIIANVASQLASSTEPTQPSTPSRAMKKAKKAASPKLIYDGYSRKYRFTREETAEEMKAWGDGLDTTMRKQLCASHCLINSIRSYNYKIPGEVPPTPPAAAVNRITEAPNSEPPQFDYGPEQSVAPPEELSSVPLEKIGSLCQVNKTIENISASEDELKKSEVAKKATVVKFNAESEPTGPVIQELTTEAAQKASNEKLRKTNNTVDALRQQIKTLQSEIRKLKHEQQKKRKRTDDEDDDVKEQGGDIAGAHQTNPIVISSPTRNAPGAKKKNPYVRSPRERKYRKVHHDHNRVLELVREEDEPSETLRNGGQRSGLVTSPTTTLRSPVEADGVHNGPGGQGKGKGKGKRRKQSRKKGSTSNRGKGNNSNE